MQPQQAPLIFTEAERPLGERLLKMALETDRVEGYTEPHAVMIARLAETIGAQMGLHGTDLSALKFAALAHDIGERGMKRNYLLQPNPLSWEETLDMWRHPILGEQSAAELQLPRQTQLLIRWHHEWWNGQGYPDGMAGTVIPLGARILRAVDSYCALISRRPHRQNFDLLDAEQIIADQAGIELDPQIVKLLLALVVGERKQREAESWSPVADAAHEIPLEVEPEFEWSAPAAAELYASAPASELPAPALNEESEAQFLASSPSADTLEMVAVTVESVELESQPEVLSESLAETAGQPIEHKSVEAAPSAPQRVSDELAPQPESPEQATIGTHEEAKAEQPSNPEPASQESTGGVHPGPHQTSEANSQEEPTPKTQD